MPTWAPTTPGSISSAFPGDDKSTFLAWFEDHGEAVAIAPGFERGKRSDAPVELAEPDRANCMMLAVLVVLLAASSSFEDSFRAGLLALQRGDLPAAQTNLEAAGKLAPRDGRVWVALSQTYWRQHKNAEAEQAAGKAATLAPEDPAVLQSLAIYYSETEQTLKAAQAQARYSGKVPENSDGSRPRHRALLSGGPAAAGPAEIRRSEAVLKEGTARLPESAQLELALGVAVLRTAPFRGSCGRVSAHHRNRAGNRAALPVSGQDFWTRFPAACRR